MEAGLKVVVPRGLSKIIVKSLKWSPSGSIERDTPQEYAEVVKGRDYLSTVAKVAFMSLGKEIPEGYKGEIEFEVKMKTGDE